MTYDVYGSRTRPDAYPSALYRIERGRDAVQQYAHGRWFASQFNRRWIDGQLEKGLLWQLEHGVHDWGTQAREWFRPEWVDNLVVSVAFGNMDRAKSRDDLVRLMREKPVHVISLTQGRQTGLWHIVQQSEVVMGNGGVLSLAEQPRVAFFANANAARKMFDQTQLPVGYTGVSLDVQSNWMDALRKSFELRFDTTQRQKEAEQARRERESKARTERAIARLRELTEKPSAGLSTAEYQEKMRLKRELRDAKC